MSDDLPQATLNVIQINAVAVSVDGTKIEMLVDVDFQPNFVISMDPTQLKNAIPTITSKINETTRDLSAGVLANGVRLTPQDKNNTVTLEFSYDGSNTLPVAMDRKDLQALRAIIDEFLEGKSSRDQMH